MIRMFPFTAVDIPTAPTARLSLGNSAAVIVAATAVMIAARRKRILVRNPIPAAIGCAAMSAAAAGCIPASGVIPTGRNFRIRGGFNVIGELRCVEKNDRYGTIRMNGNAADNPFRHGTFFRQFYSRIF